jgi:HEAT repeat protein
MSYLRKFNLHSTVLLGALCLTPACDEGEPESSEARSATIDPIPHPVGPHPVGPHSSGELTPEPAPATGSLHDQLTVMQPQKTRAGWLRFTDPVINNPDAAAILLERLIGGADAPEVRAALAEAIGRTRGDYAVDVSELLASEADPRVREMLVGTLGRQAPTPAALVGLATALQDSAAQVRAAAARTAAYRSDGAQLGDALLGLLADAESSVRSEAAQTLGVLQVAAAKQSLVALLADADAQVRLDALRAVHRIDPEFALALPVLAQLEQDDDARVQRLAAKIRG